jgi:signal transduction histidine kinase
MRLAYPPLKGRTQTIAALSYLAAPFMLLFFTTFAMAQTHSVGSADSILRQISLMKNDTNKVNAYFSAGHKLLFRSDNGPRIYLSARDLARKLNFTAGEIHADVSLAQWYMQRPDYIKALEYARQAMDLAKAGPAKSLGSVLRTTGDIYFNLRDFARALTYHNQALKLYQQKGWTYDAGEEYNLIAVDYGEWKKYDKAIYYGKITETIAEKLNSKILKGQAYGNLGWHYYRIKNYLEAYKYCQKELQVEGEDDPVGASNLGTLGDIFRDAPDSLLVKMNVNPGQRDQKALEYFKKSLAGSKITSNFLSIIVDYHDLSKSYAKMGDYKQAYAAYQNYILYRDSSVNVAQQKSVILTEAHSREEALKYQEQLAGIKAGQQRNYFFAVVAALLLVSVFIALNYYNQRRSNRLILAAKEQLDQQRAEVTTQRDQLSETIKELKAAQQQLIQAEKMASLGELTAGIAHEIQNPLNFVNNFSDVNREMIDELKAELAAGHLDEVLAIANDLQQNEEKISHHGKRADFIVKGMLQHSRTPTGEKQLTNVNMLADEFLKISYHGLRAKDKSFNAELVTNFDEQLPKVTIAQQDMGRVLLNLYTNAFYAVNQKAKTAGADYKPVVTVCTKFERGRIIITVKDNGIGMPDAIKDKIMQPFFTTKPTGQGTGLGLSLSYDIVVKGHGGQLTATSKEGEFSQFEVVIPV